MKNKEDLPYQGITWKEMATLYNQAEFGLSGFEKILNIFSHLKKMEEELETKISLLLKSDIRKCLEQRGEDIEQTDKLYRKVEKIFFSYPVKKEIDFTEWCQTEIGLIDIFKTKVIEESVPNLHLTYAELMGFDLWDMSAQIYIRVSTDRMRVKSFMEDIIEREYPDKVDIDDEEIRRQREREMKRKDKDPRKFAHRAPEMREKEKELISEHPEKNQAEILKDLQDWHLELTGKEIEESLLRYHLGNKK